MKTAVLNLKIDQKTKKQAQDLAEKLGFSLSSIVNAYIKSFIKDKTVHFSLREEIPSEYLRQGLKESEEDRKNGWVSPGFDNAKDAVAWLKNPKRKYVRDL